MSSAVIDRPPDVLVLGGGGILGEAWMSSLLVGVERAGGFRASEAGMYVGTSAGSIVASMLAAGVDPATRLGSLPEPPEDSEATRDAANDGFVESITQGVAGPLAALLLNTAAPGGRLNPTGSMRPGGSNRLGWLGPLSRTVASIEAVALRRRGAVVAVISPDPDASAAIGEDLMRASARDAVVEAGFAQGTAVAREGVAVG